MLRSGKIIALLAITCWVGGGVSFESSSPVAAQDFSYYSSPLLRTRSEESNPSNPSAVPQSSADSGTVPSTSTPYFSESSVSPTRPTKLNQPTTGHTEPTAPNNTNDPSRSYWEAKVESGAVLAKDRFWFVWNYPLTIVEDRPITPGTIVSCLVLMWVGYLAAKFFSWWFGARFLTRLKVHPSAIIPMQTIFHYVLLASFMTLALKLSNVPLTAFTFLGGAIAIGVGFGSQTIMNNFISGLILLAERPVRVGDLIEIEGEMGRVTRIGPRSTHVITPTNVVIVLPNSKLLEGTVVNWTLTDENIRTKITCGVAYGSRTRDVERWLLEATRRQPEILTEPSPFVVFAEFGDNALLFELHFWISLQEGTNRIEVESELRFEIDNLFRTAGIVMAYPQRDIHLNVLRPVDVRMVTSAEDRPFRREAA